MRDMRSPSEGLERPALQIFSERMVRPAADVSTLWRGRGSRLGRGGLAGGVDGEGERLEEGSRPGKG